MIHTEIILQRYCCKRLCSRLYFYTFFSFDCLMQSVGITAAFHNTAGLFIDNLYFVIVNNILYIFFKKSVSLQQLCNRVYTFCLYRIIVKQSIFLFLTLFRRKRLVAFYF